MVAAAENTILECRGLTKIFKDFWMRPRVVAVSELDMIVRSHEVFGLLGPNGSGKSTTIKMILGLLFPTRGRVSVMGKLPTDVAIKQRIGYLPEESYLYRFLNARETLDYYGRLFHLDRRTRINRIDTLLDMVGLDAVQRRPIGEYSKGMQRRIGLAQALINDPDLLILDEPTTGMDPIGTRQIKDLIVHLKERGKTVLLSSHLLADVEDVCDRVTILYGGKIRAEGTVDELLTVSDSMHIETGSLKSQTVEKIEKLIEAEEGMAIRRVEKPRQKLEHLFLDIVHQAQQEGMHTSGARMGQGVADFLSGEGESEPQDESEGRDLINQLVGEHDAEPKQDTPAESSPAPEPAASGSDVADQSVIEQLTHAHIDQPEHDASESAAVTVQPESASPAVTDDEDRALINDLVDGGKHD